MTCIAALMLRIIVVFRGGPKMRSNKSQCADGPSRAPGRGILHEMTSRRFGPTRPKSSSASPRGTVVDLFCGVGGLTHGFWLEGYNVAAGIDVDDRCRFPY